MKKAVLKKPVGQAASSRRKNSADIATPDSAAESIMRGDLLPAADSSDELSRQGIRLGFLIHDVSRLRRAAYDQLMKPLSITRARWWVLAHLSRHDGMMQSQLADVLEVGKASLGTVIEQLEVSGWVERRADPKDKRAKRVFLSRKAQPLMKRMTQEEDQFNERILSGLTAQDRVDLLRLLAAIKDAIGQVVSTRPDALDSDD